MGKTTITYRCGHTETMNLYGKLSERDKTIQYYQTIDCPHCRVAAAESDGLPVLTGSDKQILWARQIRKQALALVNKAIDNMAERGLSVELQKQSRDRWIAAETASRYWIDKRYDLENLHELSKELLKYK